MEKIAKTLSLLCLRSKVDTGDRDQELPSSVNAVESNDDLLTEILLRLPVISLYVFKFVSKRWLSLITHTNFNLCRSQMPNLERPIGFFIFRNRRAEYDFVSFDRRIPTKRSSLQATFSKHAGVPSIICASCNGLLLCRTDSRRYFVYNPYIDVFKMLPQFRVLSYVCTILAFDPTKSPHYKVVQVGCIVDHDGYYIHIYSSQTGNWSAYGRHFPNYTFESFHKGIYWNNAIHWLQGILHSRLDIADDPVITEIKLPDSVIFKYGARQLFWSRGCLLLLCRKNVHSRHLNIFEMRNGNSVWSLKYAKISFPRIWATISTTVWSIFLGEREEDSFIVFNLSSGKVVEFKILNKTLHKLYDMGSPANYVPRDLYPFRMHPFIALSASI